MSVRLPTDSLFVPRESGLGGLGGANWRSRVADGPKKAWVFDDVDSIGGEGRGSGQASISPIAAVIPVVDTGSPVDNGGGGAVVVADRGLMLSFCDVVVGGRVE